MGIRYSFNFDKPIYRQIADYIEDGIMHEEWRDGERIPALRVLAMDMHVNPNTVMRALETLQYANVIVNKRGVGFFVAEGAKQQIFDDRRKDFLMYDIFEMFERMDELDVTFDEVAEGYETYKKRKNKTYENEQ
jgi:DNA-binding transcriptional regulator YhcF (GntR family)